MHLFYAISFVIDSHCHLDFPDFDTDRAAVLQRARTAGVTAFINPGCDLASSERALKLAQAERDVFCGVGLHPSEAVACTPELVVRFAEMATDPNVVAIGECGLDFIKSNASHERQEEAFRAQIDLALELGLPIIVHSRGAESHVAKVLSDYPTLCGVCHCYTGDIASAVQMAGQGFKIGFTGIITFKNALLVQKVAQAVPLESILIETDAPYLAPSPHRGQRAEPAYVLEIAKKIAELKDISVAKVTEQTMQNTQILFRI